MKKRILLIGYNFYPELTGIGKYSGEMIYWLANNGYSCTVVTAYPYYPYWKIQEPYIKNQFWYKKEEEYFDSGGSVTIHRCPIYVPAKPSGIKRIFLDFSFFTAAAFKIIQLLLGKRFDTVFVIAPSFHFGLLGVLYKKIRKGKILYHIQDMQIEAARDLQLIKSERVINLLFKIEKYIFNKSDNISSISIGMTQKISEKSQKNVLLLPNWVDIKQFYLISDRNKLKRKFGFNSFDKIILYSGAIGEKQGLDSIIESALTFVKQPELKFIICGSGPYKQKLHDLAKSLNLTNVIFFPLQASDVFNEFLNMADVHLVIQKSITSDLVMPSKLTTILAVGGLALITATRESSIYTLVSKYNMGLLIEPDNQQELNKGIQRALLENNYIMTQNASNYANEFLSIDGVMNKLKKDINL